MKLAKLCIKSFGPFTDKWLDFEGVARDFHLIHGPNEAGKSSLLRAISALLFGIPERTSDNFLHSNPLLRIGGVLMHSDGRRIAFMRRKGRKNNTLLSWDALPPEQTTPQVMEDSVLGEFLGTLDAAQFHDMFGLDHGRLVQGGKDLLNGKGEVGQSLFEAGTGLLGLKELRARIEGEASALFGPRASNPLINRAINEYEEARREVRSLTVKSSDWVKLKAQLDELHKQLERVAQDLQAQRRERERLARISRNLPWIGRRAEYLEALHDLGNVPILPEEAREQRIALERDLAQAKSTQGSAQVRLARLKEALDQLAIPQGLLEHGLRIEDLYQRLQSYRNAVRQLPLLEAEQQSAQAQAQAKLREVQPDLSLEQAGCLRLGRSEVARIRHLIAEYSRLSTSLESLRGQYLEKQLSCAEAQRELATHPEAQDLSRLEAVLEAVTGQGDLESRLAEAGIAYEAGQRQVEDEIASLWRGDPGEFERLIVPLRSQLQAFEQEAAEISRELGLIGERIRTLTRDRQALVSQIAVLAAAGEVPNPIQLGAARQWRDRGWQLIRRGYIDKTTELAHLSDYDPDRPLPEAFEHSMRKADRIADLLHVDSVRVTEHESLKRRLGEIDAAQAEAERDQAILYRRREHHDVKWHQILTSLDLTDLTPRQLMEWQEARAQVLERLKRLQEKINEMRRLEQAVEKSWKVLDQALQASDLGHAEPHEPLFVLLHRCRDYQRRLTEQNSRRTVLATQITALEQDLSKIEARVRQAEIDLNEWRCHWRTALEPIKLEAQALPAEVEARLDLLEELFKSLDRSAQLSTTIKAQQAIQSEFSRALTELAQQVGAELLQGDAGERTVALYQCYQKAKQDHLKRSQLEERWQEERDHMELACVGIEQCQERLRALCAQAGCEEAGELPALEERACRKKELDKKIQEIEEQLAMQNGLSFHDLLQEAEAEDRDGLPGQIARLDSDIERLEGSQLELARESERVAGELQRMDGSARAAAAFQQGQETLARIRSGVEEYVRLKLSATLLRRAIEIYRERNQGPILKRAGEIFSMLTCGSFARLDTDFGEDDSLVLVGVRNSDQGERVPVEGMSVGTVDQLYLALRLAAIERYLETSEPVPLIVDDILIQFDDQRSLATLDVLAELSKKTQVLLFTHHRHLLDLARQHVGSGALVIHELEPRWW